TYRFCHGSVDIPTTGVDTGFQTLRQNDEEKVKCVDTASSGVDTRPSSQRTQLTDLAPSPEVAGHPFKRKDMGIKGNLWREACCTRQGSRSNCRAAKEEEELAIRMPSKQSIVD
ncbi:hypothetical protein Taro_010877, partial [Colocasia esculenta]|nr:hypothetical protein [Colocasia esculenta]